MIFPPSPTVGEQYTNDDGTTWEWNGILWVLLSDVSNLATKQYADDRVGFHHADVTGGPTSGTTELVLGTVNVPARPFDTTQVISAFWTGLISATEDQRWAFRIRQTSTAGAQLGVADWRIPSPGSSTYRQPFSIPGAVASIPANTAATFLATIQRITGTSTLSQGQAGRMSVLVLAS